MEITPSTATASDAALIGAANAVLLLRGDDYGDIGLLFFAEAATDWELISLMDHDNERGH